MPSVSTARMGPMEHMATRPKLSSAAWRSLRMEETPTPSAMIKGTVMGPVVTPPESKATDRKSGSDRAATFVLGVVITIAEPDLQVLAQTVPHIKSSVLLVTVGAGVGLFMAICMLRILTGASLRWILIVCYTLIFVLAAFTDRDFLCIAFDSGGVTTGPMTVPFILAMGLGVFKVRSDDRAEADSFGLVALCSIGPILSVLLLGFFSTA